MNAPSASFCSSVTTNLLIPLKGAAASIAQATSPFRKSIWRKDSRFDLRPLNFSDADYVDLAMSYSVIDAKLRIPIPSPGDVRKVVVIIRALPDNPATVPPPQVVSLVSSFLRTVTEFHGIGIPIAMCLLAVHKNGAYAPMDRKVARGLVKLRYISEVECDALVEPALSHANLARFATVYAEKVLPVWIQERKTRLAHDIDNDWGSAQ
ncbi:MAG: hypothetical protein EOP06_10175 [Proteobacteria bacterium]|nr:MAG: hypothetical protein EOP06_10175 [Pseudomonadota bacterium]